MGRAFKWGILVVLIGAIGWVGFKWYRAQGAAVDAFKLIPSDAIYCISTDDPIETWKQIAQSHTWMHLQRNASFASITTSANSLDSLIRQNRFLFNMIGSRKLVVSTHMTGLKTYDFLFLADLKEVSGIKFLNDYLAGISAEGYSIHKEKYGSYDLMTLHPSGNKKDLFISFPGTQLLISFTRNLVTAALDRMKDTVMTSAPRELFEKTVAETEMSGMFRIYVNYAMLPAFMTCYTDGDNEYVNQMGKSLQMTGLSFGLDGDLFRASGVTFVNDSVESYLKTLEISGKGSTEIFEIAPQRTGFYSGFGFKSFPEFLANFEKNLQQDVVEYKKYRTNLKEVEDYLNVSLQKDFVEWIGDEIALFELQSAGEGLDHEVALILKASDIEKARKGLTHIEKMVRRRTPVKFKAIDHKGYKINYLSMKGLFKVVFGKFFARYDKPYYTIINNFVVFSNHPQTLESIIDDYLSGSTLNKSEEFRSFRSKFDDEGSLFIYVNTPVLFDNLKMLADRATRSSMERNKEFIVCFRQLGFQLSPSDGQFQTSFAEQFVAPARADTATIAGSAVDLDSGHAVLQPVTDQDPMALPYIYVKNLNADSYVAYFPDSTVHLEVRLKNGFKNGLFTEYFPNGEVRMKGHFGNDKREGTWRLYDETGKEILDRKYEADQVLKEKRFE